ncbi:MAG: hypothetical protein QY304_01480 [Candidatus Paceibacterota bacterium]|nr:MAG: hypothetical protein QY304_01480 [Candidatus Paceibacterota bacterium]
MLKIALLMTLTSLTGLNAPAVMLSESGDEPPSITAAVEAALAEEIKMTDEEIVREYFKDAPIMIRIAFCESTFRQNDKDGNVLRGVQNSKDVGIMQINEYFHADKAKQMNLDIHVIEGNMEFARYLFEREGTRPWNASKKCWNR